MIRAGRCSGLGGAGQHTLSARQIGLLRDDGPPAPAWRVALLFDAVWGPTMAHSPDGCWSLFLVVQLASQAKLRGCPVYSHACAAAWYIMMNGSIRPCRCRRLLLVGRGRELAHIEACLRLEGSGIRLLSLVGSPATGKTRLSLEAAARLADYFEHGVYFVDLGTATDAEIVPAGIAHVLGATYTGRKQMSAADTLKRVLRSHEVLLVLDNFEGMLGARVMLEDLLAACPSVKILVTSREPLRVASEQQFEVAPLATPDLRTCRRWKPVATSRPRRAVRPAHARPALGLGAHDRQLQIRGRDLCPAPRVATRDRACCVVDERSAAGDGPGAPARAAHGCSGRPQSFSPSDAAGHH